MGSIYRAVTPAEVPESAAFRTIFCVVSLAVTLYWSWWWYAQRIHFLPPRNAATGGTILPPDVP
jgi:hypothetical protein